MHTDPPALPSSRSQQIVHSARRNPPAYVAAGGGSLLIVLMAGLERCSSIAEKSAEIAQSGGQVAQAIQLQKAIAPIWIVLGVGLLILLVVAVAFWVGWRSMSEQAEERQARRDDEHARQHNEIMQTIAKQGQAVDLALQRGERIAQDVAELREEVAAVRQRFDEATGPQSRLTPADKTPQDCYQVPPSGQTQRR